MRVASVVIGQRVVAEVAGQVTPHRVDVVGAVLGVVVFHEEGGALDAVVVRLARLRENLTGWRLAAECVEADAAEWTPAETFDAVLLDAPCSATGTSLARNSMIFIWAR